MVSSSVAANQKESFHEFSPPIGCHQPMWQNEPAYKADDIWLIVFAMNPTSKGRTGLETPFENFVASICYKIKPLKANLI